MTVTEEFKLAIKTGKFREALLLAISQAFELTITTSINSSEQVKLQTSINIVEGEINNQVDPGFLGHNHHTLIEQMHFAQVTAAHQLMIEQIQNWNHLLQLLTNLENLPQSRQPSQITRMFSQDLPSLPEKSDEDADPEGEWEEFLDEVEEIEVVTPTETTVEDDWGDWMEDEDWETRENNQNDPEKKDGLR